MSDQKQQQNQKAPHHASRLDKLHQILDSGPSNNNKSGPHNNNDYDLNNLLDRRKHLEAARKLVYATNPEEAKNVASFMRMTQYAWSGIAFACIFAFGMAYIFKRFKKVDQPAASQTTSKQSTAKNT